MKGGARRKQDKKSFKGSSLESGLDESNAAGCRLEYEIDVGYLSQFRFSFLIRVISSFHARGLCQ